MQAADGRLHKCMAVVPHHHISKASVGDLRYLAAFECQAQRLPYGCILRPRLSRAAVLLNNVACLAPICKAGTYRGMAAEAEAEAVAGAAKLWPQQQQVSVQQVGIICYRYLQASCAVVRSDQSRILPFVRTIANIT